MESVMSKRLLVDYNLFYEQKNLEIAFNRFDKDKSGYMEKIEFKKIFKDEK